MRIIVKGCLFIQGVEIGMGLAVVLEGDWYRMAVQSFWQPINCDSLEGLSENGQARASQSVFLS
jgi:hypothetical protein